MTEKQYIRANQIMKEVYGLQRGNVMLARDLKVLENNPQDKTITVNGLDLSREEIEYIINSREERIEKLFNTLKEI